MFYALKKVLAVSLLLLGSQVGAKSENLEPQIKVVVIDTGFGRKKDPPTHRLCKKGHKDFSGDQEFKNYEGITDPVPVDNIGHGTNVVGLIDKYSKGADYCVVIVKYYPKNGLATMDLYLKALEYSVNLKPSIINFSGGGDDEDSKESSLVKQFLNEKGIFIAAAGNNNRNISTSKYYPAEVDPRVITVGALNSESKKLSISNYGPSVKVWELGQNQEGYGVTLSGTSQATAVHTGKYLNRHFSTKKKKNSQETY